MSVLHRIGEKVTAGAMVIVGAGLAVATLTALPAPVVTQAPTPAHSRPAADYVAEDDTASGFNCATDGNHVCGPNNPEGLAAGCYDGGTLVMPWTPALYGRDTSPCAGQAPTQEQESDQAYAAAQAAPGSVRTVAATTAPRPAAGSCSESAPVPAGGTGGTTASAPAPQPSPQPQTGGLVNANTATQTQLEAMPHIGKVIAARIVEQRSVRPFASVDDLRHRVSRFPAAAVSLFTV